MSPRTWIVSDRHIAFVAEAPSGVIGFGLLNREGTIDLLYVSPEVRFRGISKALLAALEDAAMFAGVNQVRLASTTTARIFYERSGYVADGRPTPSFGRSKCYPMSKRLTP